MQKLLTIYLDKWSNKVEPDDHGLVEEHLGSYLEAGWKVISVTGFGGAQSSWVRGWITVLLEKDNDGK